MKNNNKEKLDLMSGKHKLSKDHFCHRHKIQCTQHNLLQTTANETINYQ